jgi:hypothetical protein
MAWAAPGPRARRAGEGAKEQGAAAACKKKYRERWGGVKLRKEKESDAHLHGM